MTASFSLHVQGSLADLRTIASGIVAGESVLPAPVESAAPSPALLRAECRDLNAKLGMQALHIAGLEDLNTRLAEEIAEHKKASAVIAENAKAKASEMEAICDQLNRELANAEAEVERITGEIATLRAENAHLAEKLAALDAAQVQVEQERQPCTEKPAEIDKTVANDSAPAHVAPPKKVKVVSSGGAGRGAAPAVEPAPDSAPDGKIRPGNVCHVSIPLLTVTGPKGAARVSASLFAKVLAHMADGEMYGVAKLRAVGGYATEEALRLAFTHHKNVLFRIGLEVWSDKINARLRKVAP